ncbi:MAG TPA: PAC2 family protein [Candidatus Bathyarchaeia archaeon]|nr:PAC2 family protein [Candidatus Bathyarchaeia archaeon]
MKFSQTKEPDIQKPMMIAAMQDMGDVGSIVIDFINTHLKTSIFREVLPSYPAYVIDNGGYIDLPEEKWEYRYAKDTILFGGGSGQPSSTEELNILCQDVINVAKKYSTRFIYTLGGFHTNRPVEKSPRTFVTTTSIELTDQVRKLGIETTPEASIITGFNGLILGFAKMNGIQGIGLYAELNEPKIPQYRSARSIIKTLEKLTYQKFGDTSELDVMADEVESKTREHNSQ